MHRTTPVYKLTDGLDKNISLICIVLLSLNVEKATRHSQHHVLGLYYDQDTKLIMVGHLVSLSLTTVNTESIYDKLVKLFNYFTKANSCPF